MRELKIGDKVKVVSSTHAPHSETKEMIGKEGFITEYFQHYDIFQIDSRYFYNRKDLKPVTSGDVVDFFTACELLLKDKNKIAIRTDGQVMYNYRGKLYWDIDLDLRVNEDFRVTVCNTNMKSKFIISDKPVIWGYKTSPSGMYKHVTIRRREKTVR